VCVEPGYSLEMKNRSGYWVWKKVISSHRNGNYHDIGISKVTMLKTSFLFVILALAYCTSECYAYSQEAEQGPEPRSIPNVNVEIDGGEGSIRDSNLMVETIAGVPWHSWDITIC
jgi:hypothetical protein